MCRREEIERIQKECAELGLELIPLIQTCGHMEVLIIPVRVLTLYFAIFGRSKFLGFS